MQSSDLYTQIDSTLSLAGVDIPASEVHGTVVGAVCNHLKTSQAPDLLKLIVPDEEQQATRLQPLADLLYELYRVNSEALLENKEEFDLVLPSDEESLEIRTESVAAWSKGFLLGLLYNNAFSIDQLPDSGSEIARDMLMIAEAGAGMDSEKEEDWALAELAEYLKVGSQLIFEFIYSERASDAPSGTH